MQYGERDRETSRTHRALGDSHLGGARKLPDGGEGREDLGIPRRRGFGFRPAEHRPGEHGNADEVRARDLLLLGKRPAPDGGARGERSGLYDAEAKDRRIPARIRAQLAKLETGNTRLPHPRLDEALER